MMLNTKALRVAASGFFLLLAPLSVSSRRLEPAAFSRRRQFLRAGQLVSEREPSFSFLVEQLGEPTGTVAASSCGKKDTITYKACQEFLKEIPRSTTSKSNTTAEFDAASMDTKKREQVVRGFVKAICPVMKDKDPCSPDSVDSVVNHWVNDQPASVFADALNKLARNCTIHHNKNPNCAVETEVAEGRTTTTTSSTTTTTATSTSSTSTFSIAPKREISKIGLGSCERGTNNFIKYRACQALPVSLGRYRPYLVKNKMQITAANVGKLLEKDQRLALEMYGKKLLEHDQGNDLFNRKTFFKTFFKSVCSEAMATSVNSTTVASDHLQRPTACPCRAMKLDAFLSQGSATEERVKQAIQAHFADGADKNKMCTLALGVNGEDLCVPHSKELIMGAVDATGLDFGSFTTSEAANLLLMCDELREQGICAELSGGMQVPDSHSTNVDRPTKPPPVESSGEKIPGGSIDKKTNSDNNKGNNSDAKGRGGEGKGPAPVREGRGSAYPVRATTKEWEEEHSEEAPDLERGRKQRSKVGDLQKLVIDLSNAFASLKDQLPSGSRSAASKSKDLLEDMLREVAKLETSVAELEKAGGD